MADGARSIGEHASYLNTPAPAPQRPLGGSVVRAVKGPLRLLVVEGSGSDFDRLLCALRAGGFEPHAERVETPAGLVEALAQRGWDILFADWSLPGFGAVEALAILQQSGLDLPFIVLSATGGEETAVEALRAGAHDFLLKDRPARVGPAVERALHEAVVRRQRKQAQRASETQVTGSSWRTPRPVLATPVVPAGAAGAGLAYEINNTLAVVLGNLDLTRHPLEALGRRLGGDGILLELGAQILEARAAADRVRHIVGSLALHGSGPIGSPASASSTEVTSSHSSPAAVSR
jgi:FixJ family two-component response regulator